MQRKFLRSIADEREKGFCFFGKARKYIEMVAKRDLELIQFPIYFGKHWQEDIGTSPF